MRPKTRVFILTALMLGEGAVGAQPSRAESLERHRRATILYDMGKYHEAAEEYQRGFELSDNPAFLFNMAQAYRLAGEARDALAAYRGYLRRVPNAPKRSEIESFMAELGARLSRDAETALERNRPPSVSPAPTTEGPLLLSLPPTPAPRQESRARARRIRLTLGVGAALVAVGTALGLGLGLGLSPPAGPTPALGVGRLE